MTSATESVAPVGTGASGNEATFLPYAQLARMLVPSSGCVSIYDEAGELRWSSDGYERPDLREIVNQLTRARPEAARVSLRTTSSGMVVFTAVLPAADGAPLGYLVIELKSERTKAHTIATHLLNPLVECLGARLRAESLAPKSAERLEPDELKFLIDISELEGHGRDGLKAMLDGCLQALACEAAAFVSPDPELTVIVQRGSGEPDDAKSEVVERTRRHLLAWARLNNRPMIVNRVGDAAGAAPFKILSCPVRAGEDQITGLIALFRAATGANFERRDVRLLEFLCRRAVGLLTTVGDGPSGLVSRADFESTVVGLTPLQPVTAASSEYRAGSAPAPAKPGALIDISIDRLQAVNDTFGLDAGDAVIREVAGVVRAVAPAAAVATRLAGDRFAIFLPGVSDTAAGNFGRTLLDALTGIDIRVDGDTVPVSTSIGIAVDTDGHSTPEALIASANAAASEARRNGGGRVEFAAADAGPPDASGEPVAAGRLRNALNASDFRLLVQPIVAFAEPAVPVGYEVLIRLPDATGTLLAPDRFMASANRYGLAAGVDTWVFTELLRSLAAQADIFSTQPIGVAVNVSGQSLLSRRYLETIVAEIARSPLPGGILSFEIAETDAVANPEAAEAFIEKIHETGARVALDAFGSGLTSFAQLRGLRVDYLKIAGDLIRGIVNDRRLESMVYGLAKSAESLELPTVAEHVENEALAARLEAMGFVYGQGFAFGRPAPLDLLLAPATDLVRQ